jgi:hypothetical protein
MRSLIVALIVLTTVLHCAPIVALWQATGRTLPAWSTADPYLYLTLSTVHPDSHGAFRNPWYGGEAIAARVLYFHFALPLHAFHQLSVIVGDEARGLNAWHFLMTLAIGAALIWALRSTTDDPYTLTLSFLAVMLIEVTVLLDLAQLRSGTMSWIYGLPFSRTFSPQVSIPMVFAALGVMLRWLKTRQYISLIVIVFLQFAGFITFPFSSPVILGTLVVATCAGIVLGLCTKREFLEVLAVLVASIVINAFWFSSTAGPIPAGGSRSAFIFNPSFLLFDRALITPLLIGLFVFMLPNVDRRVRAVFGALAITVGFGQLSNMFAAPSLSLAVHFDYFRGPAVMLALVCVFLAISPMFAQRTWRVLATVGAIAIVIIALLDAWATYTAWRPFNIENGQLARILDSLKTSDGTVVAMPEHGYKTKRTPDYWEASWIPLRSRATVLYSHAGAFGMPEGSGEQLDRLAAYLFLTGEDAKSVQAILSGPPDSSAQHFLAGWEREGLIHERSTRDATLAAVGRDLLPRLGGLLQGSSPSSLKHGQRIIVADYRLDPVFTSGRITRLVNVDSVIDSGEWRVRVGHVR